MGRYGLNQVTLIGRLGADPEMRLFDEGYSKAKIRLACTDSYRHPETGIRQDRTEWVQVSLWRHLAELAGRFCKKGDLVCVEGRLVSYTFESAHGGRQQRTEVEASRLVLLESRKPELAHDADEFLAAPGASEADEDDLPF